MGTLDAHLVAINAKSGRPIWNTQVAESKAGYSLTLAPLAATRSSSASAAASTASAASSPRSTREVAGSLALLHDFAPGEPETVAVSRGYHLLRSRGVEARRWVTGSFDASLNLTWGVGNAGPDWNNEQRSGDNLYTDSVVALDADTGRLKWHYQFTPNDRYDYDSQVPVLADIVWRAAEGDDLGEPQRQFLRARA